MTEPYGGLADTNNWSGQNLFGMMNNALDYSGGLDGGTTGGSYFRGSCGLVAFNGVNDPTRGDLISNGAGNGAGASFFYAHYINLGTFTSKGSLQGVSVYGAMGANASYAEMGAYTASMSNARTGGLLEGFESSLSNDVGTPGRLAGYVSVIREANTPITYFTRGYWATSQGAQKAGDAFYVDGAGGWTNFARFLHPDGSDRFRMDANGKLFIGAGARTLYDASGGLTSDSTILSGSGFITPGAVQTAGVYLQTDTTRKIIWGTGSPSSVVVASVGSLYLRTDGGTSTTLYVKQTGSGATGWVAK